MAGNVKPLTGYQKERKAFFQAYRRDHPKQSFAQANANAQKLWRKQPGYAAERRAVEAGQKSLGYRKLTKNMIDHGVPKAVATDHSKRLRQFWRKWKGIPVKENREAQEDFYHTIYNHADLTEHYSYDIHEYYQQEET